MATKPIFVATHPRACSTAFERVFMQCRDTLTCVHEPFGDAWYFGPERLSKRFDHDEDERIKRGHKECTYRDVFESMENKAAKEGKRLFIKDMAQYWIPLPGDSVAIAPSLVDYRRGVGTEGQPKPSSGIDAQPGHADGAMIVEGKKGNPTVIPDEMLKKYHFTFLIRHPRSSVPSYYRCTVPPLKELTGWDRFDPQEVGYKELRVLFEYLLNAGHIGPGMAGNGGARNDTPVECSGQHPLESGVDICVIDADDLLDNPYGVIEAYCKSVGQDYSPDMLKWADEESQWIAKEAFEKWKGFHEDALNSTELRPRTQIKTPKLDDELYAEWSAKYGEKAADMMKKTVEDNVSDYEYLRQFALKV